VVVEATVRNVVIALLFAPLVLSLVAACSKDAPVGSASAQQGSAKEDATPPEPKVTDDATNLLFSFVDARGQIVAVPKPSDVPEPVRARVLVVDLAKTPDERQAHRYAFFTDLTTQRPDGTYAVTAVSRYDGSKGSADVPALPPPDGSVLVYSAEWCGFCKKAKAWMKQNGVPFVERDVEKMPGAQAELSAKLRAAGTPGGGIPVIDWAGTLVMGFDRPRLEELLKARPPALTSADAGPSSQAP
jgi:glutaredoxin